MSVYLVRAAGTDFIKIGYAANPTRRISVLATSAPFPLVVLACRDGDRLLEGAMHRTLRNVRVHGEWFQHWDECVSWFHDFDASVVNDFRIAVPNNRRPQTFADEVIDALGGTSAVARLIESPPSTVHSWRKIGIPSSRLAHLRLIAREQGVALPSRPASEAA